MSDNDFNCHMLQEFKSEYIIIHIHPEYIIDYAAMNHDVGTNKYNANNQEIAAHSSSGDSLP